MNYHGLRVCLGGCKRQRQEVRIVLVSKIKFIGITLSADVIVIQGTSISSYAMVFRATVVPISILDTATIRTEEVSLFRSRISERIMLFAGRCVNVDRGA